MPTKDVAPKRSLVALVALVLMLARSASVAQTPAPAPIDLSGAWSLDIYLTDYPEQIARAIQFDTGEFEPAIFGPGADERERGVRGRSGRAGGEREPRANRMSADDRKLLAELVRPVQFPPPTLTIAQQGATATTLRAGERAPNRLRTDGKAEKLPTEAGTTTRTSAWVGPQLRVAYEVGRAGTLTYHYSIVPTTKQLLVRVNFERLPGEPGPFEIRLVYNRRSGAN